MATADTAQRCVLTGNSPWYAKWPRQHAPRAIPTNCSTGHALYVRRRSCFLGALRFKSLESAPFSPDLPSHFQSGHKKKTCCCLWSRNFNTKVWRRTTDPALQLPASPCDSRSRPAIEAHHRELIVRAPSSLRVDVLRLRCPAPPPSSQNGGRAHRRQRDRDPGDSQEGPQRECLDNFQESGSLRSHTTAPPPPLPTGAEQFSPYSHEQGAEACCLLIRRMLPLPTAKQAHQHLHKHTNIQTHERPNTESIRQTT